MGQTARSIVGKPTPNDQRDTRRFCNRDAARAEWGTMADHCASFYNLGDPVADAFVAEFSGARQGHGLRLLGRALDRGIHALDDPPAVLVDLLEDVDRVPAWVDFDEQDRGARAYQRTGPGAMIVLSAWALMNGYHCGPAVKPLVMTGQLEKMAPRRLVETGRFVIETVQQGALRRSGQGFKLAVRVRIMHALVRKMLLDSGRWNVPEWGVPINQADMVGTILEFSLLMIRGTEMMGYRFSDAEKEGIIQLWRYSGLIGGVHPDLLQYLDSWGHAAEFGDMLHAIQAGPDQDSVSLAQALRQVPRQNARNQAEALFAEVVVRYHDGLTWVFNGDDMARDLQIPNRTWKFAIGPTRAVIGAAESIRLRVPGASLAVAAAGNLLLRNEIRRALERREPDFVPVSRIPAAILQRFRPAVTMS